MLPGDTITVQLLSYAGVRSWSITVYGLDELTNPSPPVLSYSLGPPANYSFTFPSAAGRTVLLKSVVNGGVDVNGVMQPSYTTTIGTFSVLVTGARVLAMGETFETCPVGWICDVNQSIRGLTGGIYGGVYTSGSSASLPDASVFVPLAFGTPLTVSRNVDAGGATVQVELSGDVLVAGDLSIETALLSDGGSAPTLVALKVYQNDAGITDSLRVYNTGSLTFGYLQSRTLVTAAKGDVFSLWASSTGTGIGLIYAGSLIVNNAGNAQGAQGPPGIPGATGFIGGGACGTALSGAISLPGTTACISVDLSAMDATVNVGAPLVPFDGLAYQFDLQAGQHSILFSGGTFVSVANGSTTPLTSLAVQGGGQSVIIKYNAANAWWTTP